MKTNGGIVQRCLFALGRNKMVLVMLGGALGTYLRYLIGNWFKSHPWGQAFPYGTLLINVSGSFILGFAAVFIVNRVHLEHQQSWYLLLGTGFCGGYTTFSTFSLETANLIRDGSWWLALANVLGSVGAGLLSVFLAWVLVNALFPGQ
jgi:fluoride exporter